MGGKKKGLSLDEKRQKLLEIYYEKKEVLNLKEIEKWGPKKGIGKRKCNLKFYSTSNCERRELESY